MSDRAIQSADDALTVTNSAHAAMGRLEFPAFDRQLVAAAQMYAVWSVGRTALHLIRDDNRDSMFSAIILLLSHLEILMRGAFIAGPATDAEVGYFLREEKIPKRGQDKLHPELLARINAAHYGWTPPDRMPDTVRGHWSALCGFSHGGRATLNFFIGVGEVGPAEVGNEAIPLVINVISLSMVGVSVAMAIATNANDPEVQELLAKAHDDALAFMRKWSPEPGRN